VSRITNLSFSSNAGVAYTIGPEWGPPKTVQRWPGKLLSELANKVPTSVLYGADGKTVKEWGFGCDTAEDQIADVKEFFKLHLAPQSGEGVDMAGGMNITRKEAQRWFQDYISCIYKHVVSHFDSTIPGFSKMRVEFIFSVPTTWKDVRMIEEIRGLIDRTIQNSGLNHWACIGLTEAEAAAVYACRGFYQVCLRRFFCIGLGTDEGRRKISYWFAIQVVGRRWVYPDTRLRRCFANNIGR
jgi:hypothetical protein